MKLIHCCENVSLIPVIVKRFHPTDITVAWNVAVQLRKVALVSFWYWLFLTVIVARIVLDTFEFRQVDFSANHR